MSVARCCQRKVATVTPDAPVWDAARRMRRHGLGCLVVVEGRRPVGMLTDRDVALEILCDKLDAHGVRVAEIVARPPVTVREDAPLAEAARRIRRHGIRRLPVVDARDELVGLVTVDDLARLAIAELGGLAVALRAQAPEASGGE